jgi:hypothetical protein
VQKAIAKETIKTPLVAVGDEYDLENILASCLELLPVPHVIFRVERGIFATDLKGFSGAGLLLIEVSH